MIRLISLLKEAIEKPKAIFLAGPAGSGKSTIAKQLLPSDIPVLNIDDTYEQMLKDTGFKGITEQRYCKGEFPDLELLENRSDFTFYLEAYK